MNRLIYFILTGIFYGYSKEAIHAFIMRCCDVDMGNESEFTPTSTGTQFEHMGFIPSARELAMTVEEVASEVNSRRICKASFPYDGAFDVEFAAFTENPPADIEDRIFEVLKYLQENTYESYLRANAERRGRGDLPAGRTEQVSPGPGVSRH